MKKKNLYTHILPQFTKMFKESNSISVEKGKSNFFARKVNKPREFVLLKERTVAQKQAERKIKVLEEKIFHMEKEIEKHENVEEAEGNRNKLERLYDLELIDSDGNPRDND